MTHATERPYVALQSFRFGTDDLQVGDSVPMEAGRDYHAMQQRGLIGPAPAAVTATPAEPHAAGEALYFVDEEGRYAVVTWASTVDDPDTAAEMGLPQGARLAHVLFDDDTEPTVVALAALLPEQPTARLIVILEAETAAATDEPAPAQVQQLAALTGRVAFLELLIKAITTPGDPLAEGFPVPKELAANGLTTVQGVHLLADGEHGKANLMALDGIGETRADQILAALTDPPKTYPGG